MNIIWNEFIYGGHLLALGPTIIVLTSLVILKLPISPALLLEAYLITFIVYFFDRYSDLDKESSNVRIKHFNSYKKLIPFVLLVVVFVVFVLMRQSGAAILLYSALLLVSGFGYSLIFKRVTILVTGFKSFYVATVFASVIFFITLFYSRPVDSAILLLFAFFFMRWFINTTFCDIKDKTQDEKEGYKTYAVAMDDSRFYNFLSALNWLSIIPVLVGIYFGLLPLYSCLIVFVVPYFYLCMKLSRRQNYDVQVVTNEWADGESLLWLVLIIVGSKIWGL